MQRPRDAGTPAGLIYELFRLRERTQSQHALIKLLEQRSAGSGSDSKPRLIRPGIRRDAPASPDERPEWDQDGARTERSNTGEPATLEAAPSSGSRGWWPIERPVPAPLRPSVGWDMLPIEHRIKAAVGFNLIGVAAEHLAKRVEFVHRSQISAANFAPVFICDRDDFAVFRQYGYVAEFIDTDGLGGHSHEARQRAIATRIERIRRKWNLKTIVDLAVRSPEGPGDPSGADALEAWAEGGAAENLATPPQSADEACEAGPNPPPETTTYPQAAGTTVLPARRRPPPAANGACTFQSVVKAPFLIPAPAPDARKLSEQYEQAHLHEREDTFALYRIVGNSLPPRHEANQSARNVAFILEHEPAFDRCEKWWIVNRIFRDEERGQVLDLLNRHHQNYLELPFDLDEYRTIGLDYERFPDPGFFIRGAFRDLGETERTRAELALFRSKNNYVMNNNGARNAAIRHGRDRAKWILPWDGNCFLTQSAWAEIVGRIESAPEYRYFVVPMARIPDNAGLLDPQYHPEAREEPQLIFRCDATQIFNEAVPYGRRPKVELFWRLGIPGPWDRWPDDVWDVVTRQRSEEAGEFEYAGWVARLSSGNAAMEYVGRSSLDSRGRARERAIINAISEADALVLSASLQPHLSTSYNVETVMRSREPAGADSRCGDLLRQLREMAEQALLRGPYSVVDKTSLPPSGSPHDYWHPAPYWWPDPNSADGMPYVHRDGMRAPGTELYEAESDRYDRTRLQRLFDDSTILALAWEATGDTRYARHAATLLEHWFIEPATRMAPHLRFAQVRMGHNNNEGASTGIIEMKDFYYYLDAARIIERSGALSPPKVDLFKAWLSSYLDWLLNSNQGGEEARAINNHGTCYDLQVAAIACYLEDHACMLRVLRNSEARLLEQFETDGSQPFELSRSQTAHYCAFNLQSWTNLASLAERCGIDLWHRRLSGDVVLRRALEWMISYMGDKAWPFEQIVTFDRDRFLPLYFAYCDHYGQPSIDPAGAPPDRFAVKPNFYPHDGIKPFWMFG